MRLFLRRKIPRPIKKRIKKFVMRFQKFSKKESKDLKRNIYIQSERDGYNFQPGDYVLVRSKGEIIASLNMWGELKGCAMMENMWQYCDTVQRIKKQVTRFVDERDYHVKKCSGIYILEDLICEGTTYFGPCDRSCFYFWREEWLRKNN